MWLSKVVTVVFQYNIFKMIITQFHKSYATSAIAARNPILHFVINNAC